MQLLLFIMLTLWCGSAAAQGLRASRLEGAPTGPLLIVNPSPVGQPIRFLAGDSGLVRSMEVDAVGASWIRGPLSIGNGIGAASHEVIRIGSLWPVGGHGVVVSMLGTSTSTGMIVRDVGVSGSDNAGMVIQSQANGMGTGLRIGGPASSGRPTLLTGIDITGGTGMRYNALASGSGTAIEIGGTTAPRRGIEITATGAGHVGVLSTANTSGAGVIGISQSSSYTGAPSVQRTGTLGFAASNSAASADTLIGTWGMAVRGGAGGTSTTSIGVAGKSTSTGTSHAGTAIGVYGSATSQAPGRAIAVGGCFVGEVNQWSVIALGGNVFLGSSVNDKPQQLLWSTVGNHPSENTTWVYNLKSSGQTTIRNLALDNGGEIVLNAGLTNNLNTGDGMMVLLNAPNAGAVLTGISNPVNGSVRKLIVLLGMVQLSNENPGSAPVNRFYCPGALDITLNVDDSITLWYDGGIQRWRVLRN